ncbi:unnamed protein product [Durusdinium trenchii]|uniref:RING-type E3 ubiquitin transferase n=1 Tax=Durusdinium trenchii TaxID=1381693 RepID=A0ABP0RSF9_9DINO
MARLGALPCQLVLPQDAAELNQPKASDILEPLEDGANMEDDRTCCICLDTSACSKLPCGHQYHVACLESWFEQRPSCPTCGHFYGDRMGSMLDGTMSWSSSKFRLAGHSCPTLVLHFSFSSGSQGGQDYDGRSQHAYLPDNEEGKKLLAMFQLAFRRRVLFSLSPSLTTQRLHPTFAIHLKTSMTGGPARHGYPDEQYFNSAMEELRNAGISLEAATPVAIGLNASLASRIRQKCGFVLSQIESKLLMASLIILWITPQGRATFFPCFSILIVLGLPPKPGVAWSAVLFFTYFGTTTPRADDEEQQAEFSFVMMSIILISWLFALLKVLLTPRCSCFNRIQRKTRAAIQVPHVKTLLTILVLLLASGYETRAGRIALALCSIHLLLICICIPCPSFRSSISSFGEPLENEMEEVLRQVGANPEHGLNSCNVFVDASQRVFDEMKEEHWALYASTPSLQGRADMKAILQDFLRSVERPLRCRASGVIHEMLENEKRWASEGYVVFYHLYALSSVLYELQTALANELLDYPLAGPPVMRLSRRAFGDIRSLSQVLSIRDHNISDRAHEYRALAVSAFSSCFASGGYTRSMQRYMMQGFPSGTSNYVKKLIDDLLSAVGIDQPDVIPTLRSRILAAGKAQGLEALGQVLQIFLHDSVVDAFAYGSQPLGALAPRGLPVSAWLRQQCPIEGQVRLVPHPDLFLAGATPRGPLVRIFDHCPSRRCVGVGGVSAASDRFYRFFGHGVKGDVEAFGFCFEKGFLWHF